MRNESIKLFDAEQLCDSVVRVDKASIREGIRIYTDLVHSVCRPASGGIHCPSGRHRSERFGGPRPQAEARERTSILRLRFARHQILHRLAHVLPLVKHRINLFHDWRFDPM